MMLLYAEYQLFSYDKYINFCFGKLCDVIALAKMLLIRYMIICFGKLINNQIFFQDKVWSS